MFQHWSDAALFDEWWHLISGSLSSAIFDKIELSKYFGLRVGSFGETPDFPFGYDPMPEEARRDYRLIEEVLTRTTKFPAFDTGSYIGPKNPDVDHRAYVQWCLMTMYNTGFEAALKAVEKMSKK